MHLGESGICLYERPGFRYGFTEALKAWSVSCSSPPHYEHTPFASRNTGVQTSVAPPQALPSPNTSRHSVRSDCWAEATLTLPCTPWDPNPAPLTAPGVKTIRFNMIALSAFKCRQKYFEAQIHIDTGTLQGPVLPQFPARRGALGRGAAEASWTVCVSVVQCC